MKKTILILTIFTLLACGTKKQDLRDLETTLISVDQALQSNNRDTVIKAINDINIMLPKFKKHEAIREKKYKLEVKLKRYDDAIATIYTILEINDRSIDHRIVLGILLEIIGEDEASVLSFEKALELLENRGDYVTIGAEKRDFISQINRIMLLKLLYRDTPGDYDDLRNSEYAVKYPTIAKTITLLEVGDRARIINTYR